jgi:hypothetical protein
VISRRQSRGPSMRHLPTSSNDRQLTPFLSFGAQAHSGKSTRVHRIDLRVLDFNQRAILSYAKVGFTEEGVERETCLVNGSWHGDLIMRILESEYRARYGVEGEANRGSESP